MDEKYEERVSSILRGGAELSFQYPAISEFKEHLNEGFLSEVNLKHGWVLWRGKEQELDLFEFHHHHSNYAAQLQYKIITLFKHVAADPRFCHHYLVQFWAVVKEEEGQHRHHRRRHYLSTSDQPFSVGNLTYALCRYRKLCTEREYDVEEGAKEDQLGGVGRAYQNKQPESTPDLRLYSTDEFPLRDQAARCNLKGCLTLPLFDVHNTEECYGVVELISGLRSIHINFNIPMTKSMMSQSIINMTQLPEKDKQQQDGGEITEALELIIKAFPRLYLAQVWVPCKQCANINNNICCMEMTSFINAWDKRVNVCKDIDEDMFVYLQACKFHNLQVDPNYFCQNLCDLSISKNTLAHHAKRARFSRCFAIRLQSVNNISSNDPFVIEFFLQPSSCREEDDSSFHGILRIIEMKLKSFKVSREQLPEEYKHLAIHQSWQPSAIERESIDMLNVMNSYKEKILESDYFTNYLETVESCCPRPSSQGSEEGWVFCRLSAESGISSTKIVVKEKIVDFMKKIAAKYGTKYWIVQFWAPKMVEGKPCLETLDQPYALGCLAKGLVSFRKKCMKHHYVLDEKEVEEELGPPGRVFRSGHREITPDLLLYSTKEFSMRNYAVHCCLREYFALPVFDAHDQVCVGVLEGFSNSKLLKDFRTALEEARLCSTHIDSRPNFIENDKPASITNCRKKALNEVSEAFHLIAMIPQLHMAKVLVPYEKCDCINMNGRCMELATLSAKDTLLWEYVPKDWFHVQAGKGIIGMVLESESKACFCGNLCEFNIADQPLGLAHNERRERLNVCFAICLQSSYTEDLLYVLEFFLNQSSPEHLRSFLNFLLPILKKHLESFKMASGKQLGEELVVEVIEFSHEANNILTFSELAAGLPEDYFPLKFKSVLYGQKEHEQVEDKPVQCVSDVVMQTEQCNTSDFKKTTKRAKGKKTGFHLTIEDLKPHFGKKLEDAAEVLGVGRSTVKRACRENHIARWPCKEKQTKNPSLYERENDDGDSQPSRTCKPLNTNKKSSSNINVEEAAEKVMIKVKYEEDFIRFELCLPLRVSELFEEVAMGLALEMGSFKLKYVDEDDDEISVTRDSHLQCCPWKQTPTGKPYIPLLVRLNSK
ncbi:hypothetical protein C2S51_028022 [Perilla frutescens var. frutescens]|nr:hypothetical protein C2S51_028022 [Perilla frutescens var. frutescens]